jgi:hypothetical protein
VSSDVVAVNKVSDIIWVFQKGWASRLSSFVHTRKLPYDQTTNGGNSWKYHKYRLKHPWYRKKNINTTSAESCFQNEVLWLQVTETQQQAAGWLVLTGIQHGLQDPASMSKLTMTDGSYILYNLIPGGSRDARASQPKGLPDALKLHGGSEKL